MSERGLEYLQGASKRRLDIFGGALILSALTPVGVGVGLASMLDTRSANPVLTQSRTNGSDEGLKVFKFRTIPKKAGELAAWQSFGTFDPRASRIGMFLRQSGLDEMPQLINVLKGEMTLVGTRPIVEQDVERNQDAAPRIFDEWYDYFQQVKPGLVGEGQMYRHHFQATTPKMVAESMEMDLRYFESATLRTDLKILRQTPVGMIRANTGVIDNTEEVLESNNVIDLTNQGPLGPLTGIEDIAI